jgi:hypothetical protein
MVVTPPSAAAPPPGFPWPVEQADNTEPNMTDKRRTALLFLIVPKTSRKIHHFRHESNVK